MHCTLFNQSINQPIYVIYSPGRKASQSGQYQSAGSCEFRVCARRKEEQVISEDQTKGCKGSHQIGLLTQCTVMQSTHHTKNTGPTKTCEAEERVGHHPPNDATCSYRHHGSNSAQGTLQSQLLPSAAALPALPPAAGQPHPNP